MKHFKHSGLLLTVALLLSLTAPALAHGYIVRSIPEDRVTLERAPTRLQYWFSEDLEPDFSHLIVRDQAGNTVADGGVSENDASLMTVRLPSDLPDGAYIAELRTAFASDGHVVVETRVFFVGQVVGGVVGSAASRDANSLEVVWRGMVYVALILLFGVFTVYTAVLIPAWGNPAYRAGMLPPRVMRRLSALIMFALGLAFAGHVIAILQQAMVFFNADAGQVISQGLWQVVRIGSRFGDLWGARLLFLGIVAALYGLTWYYGREQPEIIRPFFAAAVWVMALALGTLSAGSHAAGSAVLPWLGVVVDWLHILSVGVWAGGLTALVLVLPPALRPYQGEDRRRALLTVLRHFSRIAAGALVIVISSGIYNASNWFTAPGDAVTTFGTALGLKLILIAGLVGLGVAHHIALRPEQFARWQKWAQRVGDFTGSLRLEAVFAAAVLLATGLLSATPVPIPASAENTVPPPTQTTTVDNLSITMTISPGGQGLNTYDVQVMKDGQPADDLAVQMQVAHPDTDWRSPWESVELVENGLHVVVGDEISATGNWWTLLDISDGDQVHRAALAWTITGEAAVKETRPLSIVNLLALVSIVAAIGWVLYPAARRLYHRLDLRPAALTVAFGSVVLTVIFSVIAITAVQDSQARYEATLNPPPVVVNTSLPDAASLARGESLYNQGCAAWEALPDDLRTLRNRMERVRDDELFLGTRDGWRKLPACTGDWDEPQRWDVVNYIRAAFSPAPP